MMYNTSILGSYGSCHHYEKVAKNRYFQAGFMGLFFGDSIRPTEPSDKVSACYYFFPGLTILFSSATGLLYWENVSRRLTVSLTDHNSNSVPTEIVNL